MMENNTENNIFKAVEFRDRLISYLEQLTKMNQALDIKFDRLNKKIDLAIKDLNDSITERMNQEVTNIKRKIRFSYFLSSVSLCIAVLFLLFYIIFK